MTNQIRSEDAAQYGDHYQFTSAEKRQIFDVLDMLERKQVAKKPMSNPSVTQHYLQLKLATKEAEEFGAMFLDAQHNLISMEILFTGTIDGCSVHVREVVKKALNLNARSVIFFHNHPSGNPDPSQADIRITDRLAKALELIDTPVLDHIICGADGTVSLKEKGMM